MFFRIFIVMKLLPIYDKIFESRWVDGKYLEDDQILGITTSDYRGQQRYYFNRKINKFIPVIQMDSYNIDDFDCTRNELGVAKKIAFQQNLNYKIVEIIRVRAKIKNN